jgi:Fic-DOC domain mobile mystery protein B
MTSVTTNDDPHATPLDPDASAGLIPSLTSQAELNAFEAWNISLGELWALSARGENRDMVRPSTLRRLHRRMFDKTWRWAGEYRKTDTNLGVPWHQIPTRLEQLCGDIRFQIENQVFRWDEIAIRFHHALVVIHPFTNGNGRHARLATDLLLIRNRQQRFSWGRGSSSEPTVLRTNYIRALQAADAGDFLPLLEFVRLGSGASGE